MRQLASCVGELDLEDLDVRQLLPGGAVEQREWFVNPETPIDPGSGAVHGISDAQAASWPPFRAVAAEVAAFLEGADIGGYSVSFESGRVRRAVVRPVAVPGVAPGAAQRGHEAGHGLAVAVVETVLVHHDAA